MDKRSFSRVVQDTQTRLVAYVRVSTQKQGRSGLGLAAQQEAIRAYSQVREATIIASFTEVESGKVNKRPQLDAALQLTKITGSTLVIAKLDRLSRNASFLLSLKESGVRFVATDLPDANELTIGIMALVAQQEREATSRRTREALEAARRRGVKLGNPRGAAFLIEARMGNRASIARIQANADDYAAQLKPVLQELIGEGCMTLGAIAKELTRMGVLAPRAGTWHRSSVSNLLRRCGISPVTSVPLSR